MLIIRSKQQDTLRETVRKRFEAEMLLHLRQFSPALFEAAGEEQILKTIQLGIKLAKSYDFTFRGPVRLYIELMLMYGSHFDTDPQYPWATKILNDRSSALQMRRSDLLYEKALDYQQKVVGPDEVYALEAYKRIAIRGQQPVTIDWEGFAPAMLSEIKYLYPQKAAYVGEAGIKALIVQGIEEARIRRFSKTRGVEMIIVMMMAFGHGCTDDPLYPWISRTLQKEAVSEPDARASRLERKALIWLDHVLSFFKKGVKA